MSEQQTSKTDVNILQKGMITDLHPTYMSKEVWSFARNSTINSLNGDLQFIQTEPGNVLCVEFPMTPIGFIKILNNRYVVFLTDNVNSEIGIFNELNCSYTTLINAKCLNFKTSNLIQGKFRRLEDCTEVVYWTDGLNPRRFLNIQNIPYKYTIDSDSCQTKIFTNELDCDQLLVDRHYSVPKIKVTTSSSGNLRNGTYQFGIAYSHEKQRITDFHGITLPHIIWSHENLGTSLTINIENLDRDFDEYTLIVIKTDEQGNVQNRIVGYYSTATKVVTISQISELNASINAQEVFVPRARFPYADHVEANDKYLIWAGLKSESELNYQPQAMNITSRYAIYRVPINYYKTGGQEKGYQRDERYAFGIQWLYKSGLWSSSFHIPGPKSKPGQTNLATGRDAFEATDVNPRKVEVWETTCTAGIPRYNRNTIGLVGTGEFGYHQSSEKYPDNVMFGEDKCTQIRFHWFPDETIVPRVTKDGLYINLLGIEFDNIEHPKNKDGSYNQDIIGYRIVRSDRTGQETVIATGVFTNTRSFTNERNQEVLYTNFPFNDLGPDQLLSEKPVYQKKGKERDFIPLTGVKSKEFNFYSPETLFNRVALGNELKIYTNESTTVNGFFEQVYRHPKAKLLTEFDLYFALIMGAIDGYLSTRGKRCVIQTKDGTRTVVVTSLTGTGTLTETLQGMEQENYCGDIISQLNGIINSKSKSPSAIRDKIVAKIFKRLAQIGLFSYFALQTAQNVLDIILNVAGWEQYAYQYNSHGLFIGGTAVPKDFRRRKIEYYQYLYDGINTVDNKMYNNYKREESVYLRLNEEISLNPVIDNTKQTAFSLGICDQSSSVNTTASLKYGSIKRTLLNQYGQLDGITYLDTGYFDINLKSTNQKYKSGIVLGGDVSITKMSIKRQHHIFSTELKEAPDGFIMNYSLYKNVGNPRYWINTEPYDVSSIISLTPKRSRTPQLKYNLDCKGNSDFDNITIVRNRKFYTTINSVLEFYVESTYNLEYRDYKDHQYQNFYSDRNTDLTTLFRSDRNEEREEFVYHQGLNKQLEENYIQQQRLDYDQEVADKCYNYNSNTAIYSLPSSSTQKGDSWLIYLPNNIASFSSAEYGKLTGIKAIDNQKLMFLFDKAAPHITPGRDELNLDGSGRKITLGDGGLFERPLLPLAVTDYYYAACQSKWAVTTTQFGTIFISQRQGRVFEFTQNLSEISQNGMSFWFKNWLPSKLLEDFPEYPFIDNCVEGIGLQLGFDNIFETIYLTKRDRKLKSAFKNIITYNKEKKQLQINNTKVSVMDDTYFEDASWTISYDPKQKIFISYHDWHPDWIIPGERHIMTVKNNAIWLHNNSCNNECNFYNIVYPWEVELIISEGQNNTILRSIEYFLESGKYYNNCNDFHMVLDDNFDEVIISNNEQCSGILSLNLQSKNDLTQLFGYPYYNVRTEKIEILYAKEEQKYRINQFADIIRDRGEYTHHNFPIWHTETNGYVKKLNKLAIDINKPVQLQKKFRNVWHKVKLTKNQTHGNKMILKFVNTKQLNSFR